ncbi:MULTISPECIES: TetR/AcrR family transcriptional regulator [unclassified Arthrobacter]|uniref:TetR/AcrR family transcriptional regulator n=1 Tax=unclassified Arthrobacter TaxID=235627 RepID=UPI002E020E59|nr:MULTISPECIES: helix-turn-helix domain-containing protein [unclassified Arthrobacter]MEC5191333.1 AcrR family transcriptional regulator [Arthrobacter sp. MP_M4]MEC5202916.1 AcrR family transcriptional regulator [Arthrobacter sp. MP_M7]
MIPRPANHDADRPSAAAIGLLAERGYDATSVEELADAAGMSRSTFFRKFGSKEDVVFADHERILGLVTERLAESTQEPLAAIEDAALLVFNHHLRNRETSRARHGLMLAVPALRDRELVTSHRYERAFLLHLMDRLPDGAHREHKAVAFAAATVAVHNAFLRQWLRTPPDSTENDTANRTRSAALAVELRAISDLFRSALLGTAPSARAAPSVVVTVLAAGADREAVVQAVRDALP